MGGLFSVPSLQMAFSLAPNLVDLDLLLSTPDLPGILDGVSLPQLCFFRTNVHHHILLPFLMAHKKIQVISLATCGSPEGMVCPLSPVNLPKLRTLCAPATCVPSLANADLFRLTLLASDGSSTPPLILRTMRSLSLVYSLTIDFCADDYDVLLGVIRTCSNVKKLKLLETSAAHVRTRAQASQVSLY